MEKSHSASIGTDMAYFYSSPSLTVYIHVVVEVIFQEQSAPWSIYKIILCILLILQYGGVVLFMIWYKQVFPAWDMKGAEMGQNKYSHIIGRPSFYFYPKHLRPSFYFYSKHLHAEKTILSCLQMSLYLAFNKSIKRIKVSSVIQYCVLCFVFCCISFIKNMQR